MQSTAIDLLGLLVWMLLALGGAGVATFVWGGKKVLARLDAQDHALGQIKDLLANEVRTLREMQHSIDNRVTRIEERHMLVDRKLWEAER